MLCPFNALSFDTLPFGTYVHQHFVLLRFVLELFYVEASSFVSKKEDLLNKIVPLMVARCFHPTDIEKNMPVQYDF